MKYWYYTSEIKDIYGDYLHMCENIIESDNGLFPLMKTQMRYKEKFGECEIEYKIIIEISKEDFEWKYAEMSKFNREW